MTEQQFKLKMGRFIFFSIIALFVLLLIFFILKGILPAEFGELVKILAPIKAVYFTALIKYAIANKNTLGNEDSGIKLNPLYQSITTFIIYSHISLLIALISLYALFNIFEFVILKDLILYSETLFGAYIGLIMASVFGEKIKE